jgi:hypothetical protein
MYSASSALARGKRRDQFQDTAERGDFRLALFSSANASHVPPPPARRSALPGALTNSGIAQALPPASSRSIRGGKQQIYDEAVDAFPRL